MKSSDALHEEYDTDVVVVGAGNAGLIAAITARDAGKRVLLLEASPRAERGGNGRFASGCFAHYIEAKRTSSARVDSPRMPA